MMTLGTYLILLLAVSLPVTYLLIIHRTLKGAAANDPHFDALNPKAALRSSSSSGKSTPLSSLGGTASHA